MAKLNNFEKLSLILTAQIACKKDDYWVDPMLVAKLISGGHEWALNWEYEFLEDEPHPKDDVVKQTLEILEMFQHQQRSEQAASNKVKDTVHDGFDGNNDEHFGIASVLVKDLGRFEDIVGVDTNSHSAGTISTYRQMKSRYEPIAADLLKDGRYVLLSVDQIASVLGT